MRLTLRTLLAWLDGVLTPEEQRQLGERVAGSTVATHMADRIRTAVGRTMIGAPRVDAKGIADDVNSVAEYLDNALASEQLEPFERICIESEVHLAEVASCHGMLAEVSRSGAAADTLSAEERHHLQDRVQRRLVWDRERLAAETGARAVDAAANRDASLRESRETVRAIRAAIGHVPPEAVAAPEQAAAVSAAMHHGAAHAANVRDGDVATIDPSRVDGVAVAPRPRRSSLAAWLSAALALALLLTLGSVLTWSLVKSRGRSGRDVAAAVVPAAVPDAAAAAVPPAAPPPTGTTVDTAVDKDAERASDKATDKAAPAPSAATDQAAVTEPPPATSSSPVALPSSSPTALPSASPVALPSASPTALPPASPTALPSASPTVSKVDLPPAAMPASQPVPAVTPGPAPVTPGLQPAGAALPQAMAAVVPPPAVPAMPAPSASRPAGDSAPVPPAEAAVGASLRAGVAPGEADVPIGFVGNGGVLLRRDDAATADAWTYLPPNSRLGPREDLLVPPGFHPELNVRGVTIHLLPSTRAVLSVDADGTPRIEVVFGRAVARSPLPGARLGITAGGLVGTIEAGLAEPVAVQVELNRFPGAQPGESIPRSRAEIVAASNGVAWRQTALDGGPATAPLQGIDGQGMLPAGSVLEWDSVAPAVATVAHAAAPPSWAQGASQPTGVEKLACEALSAKVATTAPLSRALRELAADKRVESRMLAAATLALVGEYDVLAEMLCADAPGRKLEPKQWSQLEASAVPLALARGGAAAAALRRSFEVRGPNGKADALWTMACGLSDAQIFAGDDKLLVEKLEDPSLVVRRYANKCLLDIVQPGAVDRLRYRPDAPPDLRREGVLWWRQQAERGLIRRPDAVTVGGRGRAAAARPTGSE